MDRKRIESGIPYRFPLTWSAHVSTCFVKRSGPCKARCRLLLFCVKRADAYRAVIVSADAAAGIDFGIGVFNAASLLASYHRKARQDEAPLCHLYSVD